MSELEQVTAERDALRAEVERLRKARFAEITAVADAISAANRKETNHEP